MARTGKDVYERFQKTMSLWGSKLGEAGARQTGPDCSVITRDHSSVIAAGRQKPRPSLDHERRNPLRKLIRFKVPGSWIVPGNSWIQTSETSARCTISRPTRT